MKYFISGRLASLIDFYSIKTIGIPSVVLMERASLAVAEEVIDSLNNKKSYDIFTENILIVCGVGNNGADGLAISRILHLNGYKVKVMISGNIDKSTEEFRIQLEIIKKLNIHIFYVSGLAEINEVFNDRYSIIVDALFGIGLSRDIEGINYDLIKKINKADTFIISVDIPSGIDSNTGVIKNISIEANKTVTFGYAKVGHIVGQGKKYAGQLIVKDIGFCVPDNFKFNTEDIFEITDNLFEYLEKEDLKIIPKRNITSNKGSYKNVIIIGAGKNMSGAVALSANASYRSGCGIVKIYADSKNVDVLKTLVKEAIIEEYDKIDFSKINSDKDIIIIGPGLSVSEKSKELVEKVLDLNCKKIIDADALNIISENKILLEKFDENVVVTPHIKEMSRLIAKETSFVKDNILTVAKEFSLKYKCITVIKDATSVISSGYNVSRINITGNSGMSKGGSGDVLTGIIAGMLSQGMNMFDAATVAVFIHGMAGDIASKKLSEYSMIASDIVDNLPEVFLSL